jgi:hypothetical protein
VVPLTTAPDASMSGQRRPGGPDRNARKCRAPIVIVCRGPRPTGLARSSQEVQGRESDRLHTLTARKIILITQSVLPGFEWVTTRCCGRRSTKVWLGQSPPWLRCLHSFRRAPKALFLNADAMLLHHHNMLGAPTQNPEQRFSLADTKSDMQQNS